MKVIFPIRFRGVSQNLQTTDIRAIQGDANLLLISKSACTNCANLGANFPHRITIQIHVAVILHVYLATRATEI